MANKNKRARRAKLKARQQRHERSKNWMQRQPDVKFKIDSAGNTVKITNHPNGDVEVEKVHGPREETSA